jgi:hypothetical protein
MEMEHTLNGLPKTLEETYTWILEGIDEKSRKYAHIILQCVAAAFRPLRIDELSQFLAFNFEAEPTPTFQGDQLLGDPAKKVLTMCSSLLAVVQPEGHGSPVVQFSHFTVKEYLTPTRFAEPKDTISRSHFSMTSAHTAIAQGCLGLLLHLDENVTMDSLEKFPLAEYAAWYWYRHVSYAHASARIEDEAVSSKVKDTMERMFDPSKHHLSVWVYIFDPEDIQCRIHYERYKRPRATPLHYATVCGMHDVVEFLIVKHKQDVNALGFDLEETPLHVALRRGHADIVQLLLQNRADGNAQDKRGRTPLYLSSKGGDVEVVRILLKQGADTKKGILDDIPLIQSHSPLSIASAHGHVEVCRALLEYEADPKSANVFGYTPLHFAHGEEVARLLIKKGADPKAIAKGDRTLLHTVSHNGNLGAAQVLLEHDADANARDTDKATPLHVVSGALYRHVNEDSISKMSQYLFCLNLLDK